MGLLRKIFGGAEGVRESMRESYARHVNLARMGKLRVPPDQPLHLTGLYGALGSRYMAGGEQRSEPELWAELAPFLGMPEAQAVEALCEYVVFKEGVKGARMPWLKEAVDEGIRSLLEGDEETRSAVFFAVGNRCYWLTLLTESTLELIQEAAHYQDAAKSPPPGDTGHHDPFEGPKKLSPSDVAELAAAWVESTVHPTDENVNRHRQAWFEEHGWHDMQVYRFSFVVMGLVEAVCAASLGNHPDWPTIHSELRKRWESFIRKMVIPTLPPGERSDAVSRTSKMAAMIRERSIRSIVRLMANEDDPIRFSNSSWELVTGEKPTDPLAALENFEYLIAMVGTFGDYLSEAVLPNLRET